MKFYDTKRAPNPDRVRMFLAEKDKLDAVETIEISIMKGEHKTDEYKKLSPFSQVPALELDNGNVITESRAICTYLEGVFPEPNLMGETPEEKAVIEMWDRRVEMLYFFNHANWFRHGIPSFKAIEPVQIKELAEMGESRVKGFAKRLDAHLADKEYLTGRFSIADITLLCALNFGRVAKWHPWEIHENIAIYRDRMLQRPCAKV